MKFIISESEKKSILKMYGLLNEQTSSIQVSIEGTQPANNTDWDLVHGILGSNRLDDDLEKRVSDKLQSGNYIVQDVKVSSSKERDKIITKGIVYLRDAKQGETPHKFFTTRGSIGGSYVQRHDGQISGLADRLKSYYKGNVKTFGPYEINVIGTSVNFKQSFFAIEGASSQQTQNQQSTQGQIVITGKTLDEFRNNIKTQTKGISIDWSSIKLDLSTYTLTMNPGKSKLVNMSLIQDNVSEQNLLRRYNGGDGEDWAGKKEGDKTIVDRNSEYTVYIAKGPINSQGFWFLLIAFT